MIIALLNGVQLPPIEQQFINTPQENAVDVTTLSGELYTDFVSIEHSWTFSYDSLTQAQYDVLRAVYNSQFTLFTFPELTIDFYDIEDQPVRMYINEKDIWNNCGAVQNVQITFRETEQLDSGSS
jgi:hypothetical protein